MIPVEIDYSILGEVYHTSAWFGHLLLEKWFDIVLVLIGYWLAKHHVENTVHKFTKRRAAADVQIAFNKLLNQLCFDIKNKTFGTPESARKFQATCFEYRTVLACYLSLGLHFDDLQKEIAKIRDAQNQQDLKLLQTSIFDAVNAHLRADGFLKSDEFISVDVINNWPQNSAKSRRNGCGS
jgi:hypothetical protein